MRHGIVEGEPGAFPAPVAKVMRAIGGFFGKKKPPPAASAPAEDTPYADLDPQPPGRTGPTGGTGTTGTDDDPPA